MYLNPGVRKALNMPLPELAPRPSCICKSIWKCQNITMNHSSQLSKMEISTAVWRTTSMFMKIRENLKLANSLQKVTWKQYLAY